MPNCVCPKCNTLLNIHQYLVDQDIACFKCGVVFKVSDLPLVTMRAQPAESWEPNEEFVGIWGKTVCLVAPVVILTIGMTYRERGPGTRIEQLALIAAIQAILMWPFYTMSNDMRKCRRLLERIANK